MLHTATQSLDHNAQRYVHQGEGHDDNSGTARSSHHNPAHASSLQQKATDHRSSPQAGFQWQGNCSPGHNQSSRKSDAVRGIDRNFQNFDRIPGSIPSNGMPGLQECYNLGGTSQSNYVDPQPSTSLQAIMLNLSVLEHKIQQLNAILQGSVQDVDKHQMVASGVSSIIYELTVAGATLLFSCQQRGAGNPRQIIDNSSIDLQLGAAIALGSDALFNHDNEVRHIASDPDPAGDPRPGSGKSNHVLHDDFGIPSSSFQPDSMEPSDPAHGFSMLEAADREWDAYDNDNWVGNSAAAGEEQMEELNVSKEDLGSGCSFRDEDAPFERGEKYCTDRISYEIVEMDAVEILAEHTHFCEICGKGFKRDANVRMHMRAHGSQYKTHEALSKPEMPPPDSADAMRPRRYSCPYVGCRRNRNHKKFQPLKSIVCVRNHYKRIHCPKMYPCDKCNKTFSVVADLKSHAKHCGLNLWQCSCGTTFSRKDKLFGHIALFEGHTPAIPVNEFVGAGKDEGNLGETSYGNARTTSANDCSSFSKFLVDLGNNSYGNNAESLFGMESSGELKTGYGCDIPMRWD